MQKAISQWLLRFVNGETGRMVESFRVYYFANRSNIVEAKHHPFAAVASMKLALS
jgi:hypothetical protein